MRRAAPRAVAIALMVVGGLVLGVGAPRADVVPEERPPVSPATRLAAMRGPAAFEIGEARADIEARVRSRHGFPTTLQVRHGGRRAVMYRIFWDDVVVAYDGAGRAVEIVVLPLLAGTRARSDREIASLTRTYGEPVRSELPDENRPARWVVETYLWRNDTVELRARIRHVEDDRYEVSLTYARSKRRR